MTALRDSRTVSAPFGSEVKEYRLRYDFSKDAGAVGALDILTASGKLVVVEAWLTVKTAATSAGAATVKWGVTGTDNKFANVTQGAVANLTANATILPLAIEGTPNDLPLPTVLADGDKVLMTIGTLLVVGAVVRRFTVPFPSSYRTQL